MTPLTLGATAKLDSAPQPLSVHTQSDVKNLPPSAPVTPTGGAKPPLTRKAERDEMQSKVCACFAPPKYGFVILAALGIVVNIMIISKEIVGYLSTRGGISGQFNGC